MEMTQEVPILLTAILAEFKKARAMDDEAWSIDEVAEYIKMTKSTVQRHYIGRGNFPEPHELPTGGLRWEAKEVKAWFAKLPRETKRRD